MISQFIALLPCIIFPMSFVLLALIYGIDSIVDNNFAICASFITLIISMFTFQNNETFNERVEIFIHGSSQSIVTYLCYIFFLSTILTIILQETGCIAAISNVFLQIIPIQLILPAIFLGAAILAFAASSSMGPIAIATPIALTIGQPLGFNLSLITATVICGTIFGENLSILLDALKTKLCIHNFETETTIFNIKVICIAFIATMTFLLYHNNFISHNLQIKITTPFDVMTFIKILPFVLVFYLAATKLDFIIIMVAAIMLSLCIGVASKSITTLRAINILFDGFYYSKNSVNCFISIFLLAGLSSIIKHNGGITYLINILQEKIPNFTHNRYTTFCFISLISMCKALTMTGQFAKKLRGTYAYNPHEEFNASDLHPPILQGMLPYLPQLALASLMANVPIISLIPYLYYQIMVAIALLCGTMAYGKRVRIHMQKV